MASLLGFYLGVAAHPVRGTRNTCKEGHQTCDLLLFYLWPWPILEKSPKRGEEARRAQAKRDSSCPVLPPPMWLSLLCLLFEVFYDFIFYVNTICGLLNWSQRQTSYQENNEKADGGRSVSKAKCRWNRHLLCSALMADGPIEDTRTQQLQSESLWAVKTEQDEKPYSDSGTSMSFPILRHPSPRPYLQTPGSMLLPPTSYFQSWNSPSQILTRSLQVCKNTVGVALFIVFPLPGPFLSLLSFYSN